MNILNNKKILFIICLVFHLLAVIFSEGFHRPDEYLGMMRMMQYKLGTFPLEELSWEYPARIRPWLQPAIYYLLHRLSNIFFIENPFIIAMIFRLVSSLLGFFSILLLIRWCEPFFSHKKYHHLATICLCFLWFLPFFHARTSAENFGITFFIFALYLLKNHLLWAGIMLGLSFIFRFQMGIMIASLMIFIFIFDKKTNIIPLILGIIISNLLGLFIDYWGYGQWTFTPWNYFYHNILLDKASNFGISPWYYYLEKSILRGIPPVSFLFTLPFLWLWIKKPTHILSFLTFPYLFIHSIIPHKEIRFIFALGLFAPVIMAIFIDQIGKKIDFKNSLFLKISTLIILIINTIALFIASLKPAYAPIGFYKYLYNRQEKVTEINILFFQRDILEFYLKNPIKIKLLSINDLKDKIRKKEKITGYYLSNQITDQKTFTKLSNCNREYNPYPNWIIDFLTKWKIKAKVWSFYHCSSQ